MIKKMLFPNMWCKCAGIYTALQIDDLIKNQGYVPVSNSFELSRVSETNTRLMGENSPWSGIYNTGNSSKYVQVCNIDLSSISSFNPLGGAGTSPFAGIYDGNGLSIINLNIDESTNLPKGLFAFSSGGIKNILLQDAVVNVSTNEGVSALVGRNTGTITKCSIINASVTQGTTSSGGGGLVCGTNNTGGGSITETYASGSVITASSIAGAFCGQNYGSITNSYSHATINGTGSYTGGMLGANYASGVATNCYSTGLTVGTTFVGGLSAYNIGTITSCYWDTQTSGQATSAGGVGKTTNEMKTGAPSAGIYTGWATPPWDFGTTSEYPQL